MGEPVLLQHSTPFGFNGDGRPDVFGLVDGGVLGSVLGGGPGERLGYKRHFL